MADPWIPYKVVGPPDSTTCDTLTSVYHVSHISPALRILEDAKITAGLVYDESILNTERIRVVWVSPNFWHRGFRYGSVRFKFDWPELIRGQKYYWVESITRYRPTAVRVLITPNDYSRILSPYDPARGDGPWWFDTIAGTHYWNGSFTLEVMIDQDLLLSDCNTIDFVRHHTDLCSVHRSEPKACPESGLSKIDAGNRILSEAIGRGISASLFNWIDDGTPDWILVELFA